MFTTPTARRTAAAVTAALAAVLIVTFGGPARTSAQRATVTGTSHADAAGKPARIPQAVPPAPHQQTPLHLDLATTAPGATPDVRRLVVVAARESVEVRLGRDVVTATGRAPPAL